jgi:hypothetical protein
MSGQRSRSASNRTDSSSSATRSQSSNASSGGPRFDRDLTASPTEVMVAKQGEVTSAHTITVYPELDRYREIQPAGSVSSVSSAEVPYHLATHDLPPPTPLFSGTSSLISGMSGSPSTRWSESPGPGPYSRDTTPTSMSSQSPGLVAPMRIPPPRTRHGSRGRAGSFPKDAPNERGGLSADSNPHTLAAIRESLTSSSSSSNGTVRDGGQKIKKKKQRLSPPPPSPPPRKSSQKFKKTRDEEESPSKPPRGAAQPVMPAASPAKATSSTQSPALPSPRAAPPARPSRDGTPDLDSRMGRPVVHSNLSSTSLSERRASTTLRPSALNRSVTPTSQPGGYRSTTRPPIGREPTPAPQVETRQPASTGTGKALRTPSPSVSTFKSRFALFGRKSKSEAAPPAEKTEKAPRKGPAAGTGHEGYGRIGAHHRRKSSGGSSFLRGLPGTMSSQESLGNHDPFLAQRMNPVVIAGGEVIENRNTSSELARTDSNQSFGYSRPSVDSRNDSQVSLSSREGRTTLWPSAFPRSTSQAPSLRGRRPSDSSDSDALAMKPTLALRRSVQRLKVPDQPQVRLPKPIVVRTPHGVTSPSVNSLDTALMSDDSAFEPRPELARGRKDSATSTPKKLTKKVRSERKWNIFGRSQSQPSTTKQKVEAPPASTVPTRVKVVPVREPKPVAFYMDYSEPEDFGNPDVQEVLRDAEVTGLSMAQPDAMRTPVGFATDPFESSRPHGQLQQPSPSEMSDFQMPIQGSTPEPPRLRVEEANESPTSRATRPSRLAQVGRIPKVVSARPPQVSPMSFSRPFSRASAQGPQHTDAGTYAPAPYVAHPPKTETPELSHGGSTPTGGDTNSRSRLSRDLTPDLVQGPTEFLSFSPPRAGSQSTSCTTSTSSGIPSFADATAIVPDPHAPLVEDEIWDEYNDLIGEEQLKVPPSAGSSQGVPFHLEGYGKRLGKQVEKPMESPTIHQQQTETPTRKLETEKALVTPNLYSAELSAQLDDALQAAQNAGRPVPKPSAPAGGQAVQHSMTELRKRLRTSMRSSTDSSNSARRPRRSTASSCSQDSEDLSPQSQVNLRVASMTVSKWLTFGHVLFSPVRDELVPVVGSLRRHSILVIDGLGNDDWSFYAAETYPAATFFNLSPRAPLPPQQPSASGFPLSPPNHYQIQYASHTAKFPFAPESFTSVVFRFPSAAPEAHFRNIIAEARRVLKPGGYLEMSILDLDLNNMGNRGRRAVRRLKERICARDPDTNLGSTADVMLRLIGTRGFSDIKSCRVGVPVASAVSRSATASDASSSSRSGRAARDNRSLAEMINDESAVADDSITNMVARVGRWWYSRCYEGGATGSSGSMWNDRMLLAECEEWRTSLKLMVCCARVPDVKRVASI